MISTKIRSNPFNVTPINDGPVKQGFAYDNRVFFSYQEVLCYQYLRSIGIPGKKIHMEFRVDRNHFDFFPLKRVFWEHHPILRKIGKDLHTYAQKRRLILDSNGYAHLPLVVSDQMFTSVDDISTLMTLMGVDFRTGKVSGNSILYITDLRTDEMIIELLAEPLLF
jgi:hypothetical protein